MTPLESLVACGTKLWLDSIDPDLVKSNRALGATGATSNPIIVSDLIKTGRFDDALTRFMRESKDDDPVAWKLTDMLVKQAQDAARASSRSRRSCSPCRPTSIRSSRWSCTVSVPRTPCGTAACRSSSAASYRSPTCSRLF